MSVSALKKLDPTTGSAIGVETQTVNPVGLPPAAASLRVDAPLSDIFLVYNDMRFGDTGPLGIAQPPARF